MFEITIKETKLVKKIVGKDWAIIGTEETARQKAFYEHDKNESKTYKSDKHGYTPEIEKTVQETVVVLNQQIDKIDLSKVIKAINNL